MTFEQCEKRNNAVLNNAIYWANGEECSPLGQSDIAILGDILNINIPKAFYNFEMSENKNSCSATGSHKTIFKTLDKIKNKLLAIKTFN
jgi:hypothetical protein